MGEGREVFHVEHPYVKIVAARCDGHVSKIYKYLASNDIWNK